jgi:hypothetical protein
MYLYGRKEGKIGLFDKVALDTSDYPKCYRDGANATASVPEDGALSKF